MGALGWLTVLALLISSGSPVATAADAGTPGASVTITRGETYLIKGVDPASEPEVQANDNPHVLIVNKQPSGEVLVLGAEAGVEAVRVTTADGRVETYTFTVRALTNPENPLEPGASPGPASEALDHGAGPVESGGSKTEAGSAPAFVDAAPPPASASEGAPSGTTTPSHDAETRSAAASPEAASAGPPVISGQEAAQKFATNPPAVEEGGERAAGVARGPDNLPAETISMRFGTSRVFSLPQRIKRVSIADTEVADLQVIDPHQLMLIGRKPGFTTLAVWDNQGNYQERQVRIEQSGHQQVMLNVVVAEVDRSRIESQGINYSAALSHYGVSLVGLPGSVATPFTASSVVTATGGATSSTGGLLPPGGSLIPLLLSSNLTYALAAQNSAVQTQTFFRYLEDNALARVLAEPQIVANSGEEAKFLSGGEIPVLIAQALNTSIVFKQFGTSVVFLPTVIGKSEIELLVKPEVSKPDFTQGVSLFGFTVPAFITQRAETMVRMKENQTLIIAGLILRDRRAVVNKVPYLGDIPWAGGLFRNTSYQDNKTELVMSVTPQIVRPIPANAEVVYPRRGALTSDELRTTAVSPLDASRPRF